MHLDLYLSSSFANPDIIGILEVMIWSGVMVYVIYMRRERGWGRRRFE